MTPIKNIPIPADLEDVISKLGHAIGALDRALADGKSNLPNHIEYQIDRIRDHISEAQAMIAGVIPESGGAKTH